LVLVHEKREFEV